MTDDKRGLAHTYMTPSETRRCNARAASIASMFLNIAAGAFNYSLIKEISDSCGVSREYAFAELLAAKFDIDSEGADKAFFRNYIVPMMNYLDSKEFRRDPYYKNVAVPDVKKGDWELKHETLSPGEAFVCRDFLVTDDGRLIPQLGFFSEPFTFPAVLQRGREWMTLMPNETVTTAPAIERARGKVLTYGLGLGYFAYMASGKESVSSVTVVELDPDVIALFKEFILPQFPHKEKINVIRSDAFEYAKNAAPREGYDFVFADFWHDAGDGRELYLKIKEFEKYSPQSEYVYWLEDSIKRYLDKSLWP